jgi:hypothetical protein
MAIGVGRGQVANWIARGFLVRALGQLEFLEDYDLARLRTATTTSASNSDGQPITQAQSVGRFLRRPR